MCSAWLSIHSPQYSSRRRSARVPSTVDSQASSTAAHADIWYATGQIPHTRAVMSGTSVYPRPTSSASKNRGGS